MALCRQPAAAVSSLVWSACHGGKFGLMVARDGRGSDSRIRAIHRAAPGNHGCHHTSEHGVLGPELPRARELFIPATL